MKKSGGRVFGGRISIAALIGRSRSDAASMKDVETSISADTLPKDASRSSFGNRRSMLRSSSLSAGSNTPDLAKGSVVGAIHKSGQNKLMQLSTGYRTKDQLEEIEGIRMPPWVIHPLDRRAHVWWAFILVTVLVTMIVEPYCLAFAEFPGLFPPTSPDTILTILLMTVYAADIILNFLVAYYDEDSGFLVTDKVSIARHYAEWRLWVDLGTTIPFDWIVLGAMGLQYSSTETARYVSLLRLLRLGRAYRLKKWIVYLTNNANVSLFAVTVVRNALIVFFTTHVTACLFYYIARQTQGMNWLGAALGEDGFVPGGEALPTFEKYVFSLYFATVTFATVGYGDIHAYTVAEAAFLIVMINVNVFIGAYIIGTITLMVTRADQETGQYRSQLAAVKQYGATHDVPKDLQSAMRGHLRLHYSAQESSDEKVLSALPSALRRRVLRHMYLGVLQQSWLLKGTKQKFLDALLASAKIEHIMPKVEIVSDGDQVNELMVLVAGGCMVESPRPGATGSGEHIALNLELASVHGAVRNVGPGQPLAEMAFFTETPSMQVIRTTTVCRVLSLSRTAYMALSSSFPISTENMLDNLMAAAEEMLQREFFSTYAANVAVENIEDIEAFALRNASPELMDGVMGMPGGDTSGDGKGDGGGYGMDPAGRPPGLPADVARAPGPKGKSHKQQMALSNLVRVRMLVGAQRQKLQRERTAEFLEAAAQGNVARMRAMMQQGLHPDSSDYDGRTALMLASAHGHMAVIKLLLSAGANPSQCDNLQGCALLEAARGGHEEAIAALLAVGAKVKMSQITVASHLCTCVFDGDVALLRRLLRAGLDPDAGDYDGRRAAHIAAAESALAALKVLVEEAGANMTLKDRWGLTPLDEARRCSNSVVVAYLEGKEGGPAAWGGAGGGSA